AVLGNEGEAIVEPQLRDAMDVAERLGLLEIPMVVEPPLERREDLLARQRRTARPAHREHEREAELRAVVGVERTDARELVGRPGAESGAPLLARGLGR